MRQRIIANSVSMRKEIWDDDLSMISPRYDQKYWLLNNDPAVTVNNSQMSVAPPTYIGHTLILGWTELSMIESYKSFEQVHWI